MKNNEYASLSFWKGSKHILQLREEESWNIKNFDVEKHRRIKPIHKQRTVRWSAKFWLSNQRSVR